MPDWSVESCKILRPDRQGIQCIHCFRGPKLDRQPVHRLEEQVRKGRMVHCKGNRHGTDVPRTVP